MKDPIDGRNFSIENFKCQSIYQNLLEAKGIPASAYIREFFQTDRCDGEADFTKLRDAYKTSLNDTKKPDPLRLTRVLNFEETEIDEKIAAQACLHYANWHNKQLVSALNWPNWFYYHILPE
eukprot:gene17357-23972_t